MKHLFFICLLFLAGIMAQAQTPTPPAKQPTELRAGRMQAQRATAANRPDVAPQFPGGTKALSAFFQQQVKYPEAARVSNVAGDVVVQATVAADGKLQNPTVVQSLSPACDAEALRVLALMPAWQPATRKGQPVAVLVRVPVPFGNSKNLKVEQGKTKFE